MTLLHAEGAISRTDLNRVHAGAFIAFQTYVEAALERLFYGTLMGRLQFARDDVRPLVQIQSDKVAHAVVLDGRRYVDWLPYNDLTRKRARAFLSGGRPFTTMEANQRQTLDKMAVLRNALAHEGGHAIARFRAEFTDGKTLPADQRSPAGYLRGQHALGQSRFDYLLAEAVSGMRSICT